MQGRNNRGGGRYGSRNGNDNGNGNGKSGNRRGGNKNYRGRGKSGGGKGRHNNRSGNNSGNLRERIAVESGHLVIIDQFMLANPQFQAQLVELLEQEPEHKNELIAKYGGIVVELEPNNYRILRNPYSNRIVIHDSKQDGIDFEEIIATAEKSIGDVLIDTRCLAMIDRELLDDTELLQKYQDLWFSDQDKACRDLLRDNGGAVRYGFKRFGDELEVYYLPQENTICLAARKEDLEQTSKEEKSTKEEKVTAEEATTEEVLA